MIFHFLKKKIYIILLFLFISPFTFAKEANLAIEENIFFDVVQKKIQFDGSFPLSLQNELNQWFSQKIKVNGFEGSVHFFLSDYREIITNIDKGKKADLSFQFTIDIVNENPNISQKIVGSINSYSSITGNFSLNDFDEEINKAQDHLIMQLHKKLINTNFSKI